ncbi:MAG: HEAT repeat domain-containing protein [Planctomycetota bacterium]
MSFETIADTPSGRAATAARGGVIPAFVFALLLGAAFLLVHSSSDKGTGLGGATPTPMSDRGYEQRLESLLAQRRPDAAGTDVGAQQRNTAGMEILEILRGLGAADVSVLRGFLAREKDLDNRRLLVEGIGNTRCADAALVIDQHLEWVIQQPEGQHLARTREERHTLAALAAVKNATSLEILTRWARRRARMTVPVRAGVLAAIGGHPQGATLADDLLLGLNDDSPLVRIAACDALGQLRILAAVEKLLGRVAGDPDDSVRQAAIRALSGLQLPAIVEPLAAQLSRETVRQLRLDLVDALVAIGTRAAGEALERHASNEREPRVLERARRGALQILNPN